MLRPLAAAIAAFTAFSGASHQVHAQTILRIGAVLSMTGPFNDTGKSAMDGAQLYIKEHGSVVAGRRIEVVVKDDASMPEAGKRLAQELIVNNKVGLLLGGITPSALSIAPLTAEAKIPMIVVVSGSSTTVERSPYILRTSFTLGQSSSAIADWAIKNGAKRVVTLVNDWAPGLEADTIFKNVALAGGAQIIESPLVPLLNPDFSPYLQRVRDAAPDTMTSYPTCRRRCLAW
jgi:branched-chain amino acid transport system substrate-binding protein